MATAGAEPPRGAASSADESGIRVLRAANIELRRLREADREKARAVDAAIRRIPREEGAPIRLSVPDAPADRHYWAMVPSNSDAHVVIYRKLETSDHVDGKWLVTTLIDRDKFNEYLRAERRGLLDDPAVRDFTAAVAGTVSSIIAEAPPGSVSTGND